MRVHPTGKTMVRLAAVCLFLICTPLFAEESTISLGNAVLKTLEASPVLQIDKERVRQREGTLQSAAGQFDWVAFSSVSRERQKLPIPYKTQQQQKAEQDAFNQIIRLNEAARDLSPTFPYTPIQPDTASIPDESRETTTIYSLGLAKQLRNGLQIIPSVSTIDYGNNTTQTDEVSRSDLDMEIVIPLMRGLGERIAGANELAARSNLTATQLLARHSVSQSIFSTASAYWNCLAAQSALSILKDTEKRAREVYDLVHLLVRAGELEPAVMHQARGQIYERQRDLTSMRLRLREARQAMALAMGLTPGEMADAPMPEGPFPAAGVRADFGKGALEAYLRQAENRRGDFLAAKTNVETEIILLEKARNDTKPRLDLTVKAGYAGMDESDDASRYYNSVSNNLAGLNAYAGIRLELPIYNDAARGEVLRRNATRREAELTVLQLSNRIASEILVAMERLEISLEEYRDAMQSSEAYGAAVEHERYKAKMGEANVMNLVDMEERYHFARLNQIEAMRSYAIALAELRFVTGTILNEEQEDFRFRVDALLSPPPINQSKQPEG